MKALCAALTAVVVALGVVTLQAQKDPRIGRWTLNVAKSTYNPGPAPRRQTLRVEAAGQGEKLTSETTSADGDTVVVVYTAAFDGSDYPLTGSRTADTVSLKRIDERTTERTDKKGGRIMQVITRVVSPDGKTMTTTLKGINAQGRSMTNVAVFEKR